MTHLIRTPYSGYYRGAIQQNTVGKWLVGIGSFLVVIALWGTVSRIGSGAISTLFFAALVLLVTGGVLAVGTQRMVKGYRGEMAVVSVLLSLSDDWWLFNNLRRHPKAGNIDHILAGPSGVYVIETKTMWGRVYCNGDSWEWRPPAANSNTQIPSYSKKVQQRSKMVQNALKKRGLDVDVEPLIVFADPRVDLWLDKPTVKVIRLDNILSHIPENGNTPVTEVVSVLREFFKI